MRATVGRSDSRTVGAVLFLTVLSVGPTVRLAAQVSFQAAVGVRYTSTMVHDSIVTAVDLRPTLAPTLSLAATAPMQHGWSAEGMVDVSWSTLERHDQGGPTVGLGGLATVAAAIGVRRPLAPGLSARLAIGGLKYFPGEQTGVFQGGSGGVFPLAAAALSYVPPFAFAARWGLGVEARYDLHAFITPALRSQGFTSARPVHRLAFALRTGWPHPAPSSPPTP
jgi:hypothetical protein